MIRLVLVYKNNLNTIHRKLYHCTDYKEALLNALESWKKFNLPIEIFSDVDLGLSETKVNFKVHDSHNYFCIHEALDIARQKYPQDTLVYCDLDLIPKKNALSLIIKERNNIIISEHKTRKVVQTGFMIIPPRVNFCHEVLELCDLTKDSLWYEEDLTQLVLKHYNYKLIDRPKYFEAAQYRKTLNSKLNIKNNVPASKFILNKSFIFSLSELYPYTRNFDSNFLNTLYHADYLNFGTDGIIRDLMYLNRGKTVWYSSPGYMMTPKYAKEFNLILTDFASADVLYIEYPNGQTGEIPDFKFKHYNKTVILDFSYYIYDCENYSDFMTKVNKAKNLGYYVIYGASKMLGLPGLRVGFCNCLNPEIFNAIHQPWQITSTSKLILDNLYRPEIIDKHVKAIKQSKRHLAFFFREYIKRKSYGPILIFNKDVPDTMKAYLKEFQDYYRLSVFDVRLMV